MRKTKKRMAKILLSVLGIITLFLLSMTIYNHIMLTQEAKLIKPNGTFVTVDGYKMHVYCDGLKGNRPSLLIMSAYGTAAPVYDYKVLYSKLADEYHIVVVDKFGYGYSDISGLPRDVGTTVKEYREALKLSGENGPFVLMPHSMSGLDALYWAQYDSNEVQLKNLITLGCYFSINAIMIKSKAALYTLSFVPKDKILVESDGP